MAKFKYKIKELIDALPRSVKIKSILDKLEAEGITKGTFYRDQKIKSNSRHSIPMDRMIAYSKIFNVSIEHLMHIKPLKMIKSPLSH
ncbi:MAG: hypothetical protein ACK5QK_15795 [Chryseotalea sp.]